jgi:phage terminase small subunit
MGRPRKSAQEHVASGTYKASRHAESSAMDLPIAVDALTPTKSVPAEVHEEWRLVASRLVEMGILIDADRPLLESAFVLLADARYYHELIDRVKKSIERMEDDDTVEAAMAQAEAIKALVSLNGMHIKAVALFSTIISKYGITPSERAKILHALPKRKDDAPKKSIRNILKK